MTTVTNERAITYFGSAKEIVTKFGPLLKVSFNKDDLQGMIDNLNDKGWVNLDVQAMKTPTEFSTHSVRLNEYKPKAQA